MGKEIAVNERGRQNTLPERIWRESEQVEIFAKKKSLKT